MKFVLADTPRYWWPVVVSMPDNDNAGAFVEVPFKVLFEPRDQDEELAEQNRLAAIKDLTERIKEERKSLASLIKDWQEIVDPDKTPVPFSAENLDRMLRQSWARAGVIKAYQDSLSGGQAHLGN
ncbi:MAG: hypothetical protein ABJO27_19110 [Pseudoruegeria sp.]